MFSNKHSPLTGKLAASLLARDRTRGLAFAAVGMLTVAVMLIAGAGVRPTRAILAEVLLLAAIACLGVMLRRHSVQQRGLCHLAAHDPLTGLANRLHFNHAFQDATRRHLDHGHPVALISLDIDHFKRVNDKWGHASGDAVLKMLAQVCLSSVRPADTVARLGGEEFGILLPGMGLHEAAMVAERLRVALGECRCAPVNQADGSRLPDAEPIRFTASFGVSEFLADDLQSLEGLLRTADARLYQAKAAGRNRVISSNAAAKATGEAHHDHAPALACVEVTGDPEGSWSVVLSGSESIPARYATEERALGAGWHLARQHGLALRIHGADGITRERHIYDHARPCHQQHQAVTARAAAH